jgi:hypothetical protein
MLSKRKKKEDWCISYDENVTSSGRINFTLGHELGHYLLHWGTRDNFVCGQAEVLNYGEGTSRKQEAEANKFASFLLMPADDFRQQVSGQVINLDALSHCAVRYGTSFTATALKWLEITDAAAMLVVVRDDFVCWSYPSTLASRLGCYMAPGTALSPDCLARLNERSYQSGRRAVPAGVWHSSLEAEESLIVSDQFDVAIFLLRFPAASGLDHAEETDSDAADFLNERAKGLNWTR